MVFFFSPIFSYGWLSPSIRFCPKAILSERPSLAIFLKQFPPNPHHTLVPYPASFLFITLDIRLDTSLLFVPLIRSKRSTRSRTFVFWSLLFLQCLELPRNHSINIRWMNEHQQHFERTKPILPFPSSHSMEVKGESPPVRICHVVWEVADPKS